MPARRFISRLKRLPEQQKEDLQWRVWNVYAGARTIYHALTANQDLPTTKRQYERQKKNKPPNPTEWDQIQQAYNQRVEHDQAWREALSSPAHFAQFLGMPQVFGEVPKKVQTAQEVRHENPRGLSYDPKDVEARTQRICGMLDRLAEKTDNEDLFNS